MADTLSDSDVQRIQQIVNSDPQIQQLLQQAKQDQRATVGKGAGAFAQQYSNQIKARLQQLGATVPHDYGVGMDGKFERAGFLNRNQDWIAGATFAGLGAGPFIAGAGAAGGGAAAGGGGSAASGTAAGGGVAGGSAAAAGGNVFSKLFSPNVLPYIIGGGVNLIAAKMQANAANKATDAQTASSDKAAQVLKEMYEQERADLAPYRAIGLGGLGQLSAGMGYTIDPKTFDPTQASAPPKNPAPYVVPGAKDASGNPFPGASTGPQEVPTPKATPMGRNGLSSVGALSTGSGPTGPSGTITVMAPNGEVRACTPEVAERALAAGARRL
jgi:hypothetical protein